MLTNKNNERPFRKESRNQAFHLSQASFKPMINIALWSIRFRSLITQRAYVDTVLRIFREREMFLKTIIVRKIKEDTPFIIYLRLLNNRFLQFFFKLFREKKILMFVKCFLKIHEKQRKGVFYVYLTLLSTVFVYLRWRYCVIPERGKQRRSKWESWHELAVKSCIWFRPRRFSESTKKTDVSIAVAERPRWSTMAANRIYISGESVFTPANHPRVQASYEGD